MTQSPPDFSILGLDHVVIRVRDLDAMVAFYRDQLGCPVERVVADFGLVQLRAGSALVDLVDAAGRIGRDGGAPPGAGGGNMDHLCLRIEPFEADALAARLATAGIDFEPPARRYGADGFGQSIYLRDPEGNRIELKGPPETEPS
ncbi:MAG TPA: VOC family protein [Pseudomonadales bacterium]|nr:VOC family protein [Pseudomonadales bacterium]